MSQETSSLSNILRLELTMQVEKRVRQESADKLDKLQSQVDSLKQQLEQSNDSAATQQALSKAEKKNESHEKQMAQLQASLSKANNELQHIRNTTIELSRHESAVALAGKKNDELSAQVKKLKKSFYESNNDTKEIKSELAELKAFDPKSLKRKLDENKKKLAEKTAANSQLTSERKKLKDIIALQAREIKSFEALSEASKSDYLYNSEDKLFQVIGTIFNSESHPAVVKGMNYRVVNQETGASFVTQFKDSKVTFAEDFHCPDDVLEYLQTRIEEANQS